MSDYSLRELAETTGVSPRTIRYYVAQGLLPGPAGAGPAARYGDGHLGRLRLIRQLQARHLPLAEIRIRLASLNDRQVGDLVGQGQRRVAESAVDYVRSVLGEGAQPELPPAQAVEPMFQASGPILDAAMPSAAFAPRLRAGIPLPAEDLSVSERGFLRRAMPMPAVDASTVSTSEQAPPERSQWDRIALTPNVELHVRRPLGRLENRRVERLVSLARDLLKEDTQ